MNIFLFDILERANISYCISSGFYQINFSNPTGPNLGERCGNEICSNTQTCCRTCDQFGDPTVPNGCSTRCPQVFCQPVQSTTKRPNSGGGIDNGQTGKHFFHLPTSKMEKCNLDGSFRILQE